MDGYGVQNSHPSGMGDTGLKALLHNGSPEERQHLSWSLMIPPAKIIIIIDWAYGF